MAGPIFFRMLHVEFAQFTDPGRTRSDNEDFLGSFIPSTTEQARSHGWLFAVADGVGGHDAGEVASRLAVESLVDGFGKAPAGELLSSLMRRLVQTANEAIYSASHDGATRLNMATTLVACGLRHDRAVVAHVGDSRCYLIRGREASAVTRDHTVVNDQVRLGVMSSFEAAEAPTRHLLSRSLGSDLFVNVDIGDHAVNPGDVLLLCSDGLHGSVKVDDMTAALQGDVDLDDAARRLGALANERDGGDNISVQLIRVRAIERMGMYRGRPYKLR